MNDAQIHLALIHFPVAGIFFSLGLLAWAVLRRSQDLLRAALGALVLTGVAGLAAYWTGEGAEETLKLAVALPGGWIHTHEEAAEAALIALEFAAALALGGLLFFRRSGGPRPAYLGVVFAATVAAAALLGRAAHHGGQIRHTEIRPAGVETPAPDAGHEHAP